ncbi:TniQ family protein [Streptomyces fimicarius]
MRNSYPSEPLHPLPLRVRPRPGEFVESFIARLARANHIKPHYIHRMLSKPPLSSGDRDLAALAVLASTSNENLRRTLSTSSSAPITVKPSPERTDAENAEAVLFFDIQRDARGRSLTVRSWTALAYYARSRTFTRDRGPVRSIMPSPLKLQ